MRTVADLCRRLGIAPRGGNYETIHDRARELGVDVRRELAGRAVAPRAAPPSPRRRWSDAELLDALTDPEVTGLRDLCLRLGLRPYHGSYRRVRDRAAQLGVPLPSEWSTRGPVPGTGPADGPLSDRDRLAPALASARNRRELLEALGLPVTSHTYAQLRSALARFRLPTDHLQPNASRRTPLEELLVRGRLVTGLGRRLVDEGVKPHRCERCLRSRWEGAPIPLELDHVNGDRTDNRLENLRLLCPNCHALTPTYRGRNIGRSARRRQAG